MNCKFVLFIVDFFHVNSSSSEDETLINNDDTNATYEQVFSQANTDHADDSGSAVSRNDNHMYQIYSDQDSRDYE